MDRCNKCQSQEEDLRALWMSCFYEMNEMGLPFQLMQLGISDGSLSQDFYILSVCKNCRADWMIAIKDWFTTPKQEPVSCGSGIYVRELGKIKEVTAKEFNALRKGKQNERMD